PTSCSLYGALGTIKNSGTTWTACSGGLRTCAAELYRDRSAGGELGAGGAELLHDLALAHRRPTRKMDMAERAVGATKTGLRRPQAETVEGRDRAGRGRCGRRALRRRPGFIHFEADGVKAPFPTRSSRDRENKGCAAGRGISSAEMDGQRDDGAFRVFG